MIRILNLVDTERIEETIIGTSCNSVIVSVKCLWENKIAKEGQPLLQ